MAIQPSFPCPDESICPVCGSGNGVAQSVDPDGGTITFRCSNCIACWSEERGQPSSASLREGNHRRPVAVAQLANWRPRWQSDPMSMPPDVRRCVLYGSDDIAQTTHGSVVRADCHQCGAAFEVQAAMPEPSRPAGQPPAL